MKHFLTNFLRMGSTVSTPPIRSAMRSILLLLGLFLSVSVWGAAVNGEIASSLAAGDQVVLINKDANKEFNGISSNVGQAESYTGNPAGNYILTVETGKSGSGYSLKLSDGSYLAYTSTATSGSNNLYTISTPSTTDQNKQVSWTISFDSNNQATITNVYNTGRKLQYNSSATRFCCYYNNNSMQKVKFFKLTGTPESTD